jgi:hypothetical protein
MIRRIGIAAIVLGAVIAMLTGAWIIGAAISAGEGLWIVVGLATGLAVVATAAACAWLAARDFRAGYLSERAEWWTWTATAAFAVPLLLSVWLFYIGLLGAFASFVAVRLARGPRLAH